MRGILSTCVIFCGCFAVSRAEASVSIGIDLTSQTMHVRSASGSYDWPVSTARSGYRTPRGSYHPYQLQRMHYSRKYHMSPMPYSIFFAGGYAIHGTYSTGSLGRPASHGCIRLAPGNAAALYHMVQSEGARITISGSPPRSTYYAGIHRRRAAAAYAAAYGQPYNPLSYMPGRNGPVAVRAWQTNPVVRSAPQGFFWP
jgi:L,D-transpeptidase catalytic domain